MTQTSLANELFSAMAAHSSIEEQVIDAIGKIFGFDWAGDPPCDDATFDSYDASFELKVCRDELRATPEQCHELWGLGFDRFWLCHKDGSETHYAEGYESGSGKVEPKP